MKFLLIAILVNLFFSAVQAQMPKTIIKNNEAARLLEKENNVEAYKVLNQGLSDSPFQPELHLNLGFTFERTGENEKALAEYNWVAQNAQDPNRRYEALFNAARLLGQMKKIDEALATYQKALEVRPDSLEVKTNIELLFQQGGGGGQGEQDQKDKQQKEQQNQEGKDQKQPDGPPKQPGPTPKPKPKPFQSQDLSERDVKNILDELKRQENQIRAKEFERKSKENSGGKDW